MATSCGLDQATANELFDRGAVLVFLDVPVGTEFGIDYNSWTVGPKFKGVKLIPPGIHFVYYSAVSHDQQAAPRTGFFHNFSQGEVLVKKWDPRSEDISDTEICQEEQERFEANKKELDRFLGAYPYDSFKKWVSLTNHLTPPSVDRLLPENRKICAVAQFDSVCSTSESRAAAAAAENPQTDKDDSRLPNMQVVAGTEIRFTSIPKKTYPESATPQQVTKYSMDHSYVLENLLSSAYVDDPLLILGELQFAFVCFLIGQVYDGFDQWKRLVGTLCCSDEALSHHPRLFSELITTLHYQVHEIPEDFFVDIVTQNNFLVSVLHVFFDNVDTAENDTIDHELKNKAKRFKSYLQRKFKWDFTQEPDDECPVIVK